MSDVETILALAEHFLELKDYEKSVHCYLATLNFTSKLDFKEVGKILLRLGTIYLEHTSEIEDAKVHFMNAVSGSGYFYLYMSYMYFGNV